MMQTANDLYNEKVVKLSDWSLKVLTYCLGREYVCIVSNMDPSATICRVKAESEEQAIRQAMEMAGTRLRETTSVHRAPIVLNSGSDLAVVQFGIGGTCEKYSPEEFRTLDHDRRAEMFLSGSLQFFDSRGMTVSSGEAVRLLLALM